MIERNKHTEEHKASNKKTVKINGKKKLLLFDNEEVEGEEQITETELQEIIKNLVSTIVEEL